MDLSFPKLEQKILKFWKENGIFEKSILRFKKAPNFVFYEGPPTANAKPGIHHILSRVFKDIICRYKTMQGFKVLRKAGWDTHGLPVELEIEKKLGLKNKKDIEKFGIAKFNELCKESVWNYKKDWEKLTERIAFWLDTENPYITYTQEYIETVWWIIKKIHDKGLIYQDYKVVPYCPRCGTSLSSHEVAQGYQRIKEPAIYVKLRIKNPEFKDSYLLFWTTTPWTLPANVALAVNPGFTYVKVKTGDDCLILAKERMESCGVKGEIIKEFKGKDLVDLRYEPLYLLDEENLKNAYKVISADFVSLEEGTGFVHIAPAFGEEDMEAIKNQNLKIKNRASKRSEGGKENESLFDIQNDKFPILLTVDEEGKFILDVKKWAGLFVKDADPKIVEDLKRRNLLFKQELYEHDYPFCWRCKSPLIYYAKQSWFINMQKVKKDLILNNQKINWVPAHLKEGRFGEWLNDIKDWAFSRERYWGTSLPIWECKSCKNSEVIGSIKDLLSQKFSSNNYYLFRHGHSLRQVKNVAMCWPEKIVCPLTKKGEEEVKISAKRLKSQKIDVIFSSDLLRTKQTAEIVAKETGAKIIFDKRLREYNVGIFNGKPPGIIWEFLNKKKNITLAKPQRGESLVDIQKRMYSFLKNVNEKYQNKNIVIISHELPLTILEKTLDSFSLEEILKWRKRNKGGTISTGKWRRIEFVNLPHNARMELDFHRPYVDEVKFYCPKCEGIMERALEVIDCWFDSGCMPFAQYHYPFDNKKLIDKKEQFPADYISEAIDQTRGWFYTLLAISTLLDSGAPYKNVISLGHVLDEKGEKMSKSKGNVVDPWYIIDKYGADAARWYFYTINQPGDPKMFSEKDIDQALKRFILTLWNSHMFYNTYADKRGSQRHPALFKKSGAAVLLDKWIISKLNSLVREATQELDNYDVTGTARAIEKFVIEDLSQWYIRRSRRRFQKPKTKKELEEASKTLGFVLLTLSKMTAPFIPFLSEEIYRQITENRKQLTNSVHLEYWPKVNKKSIDKKLEEKMGKVREIAARALAERAKAGIKVRQPLNELQIGRLFSRRNSDLKKENELLELIKEEVNVKKITFGKSLKLDTKITPELKEEGIIREIIRNIQEMRKKANLKPKDRIKVWYSGDSELNNFLLRNKEFILAEAKVKDLTSGEKQKEIFGAESEIMVDQKKLWLAIKKV